jgi:hypothetical protein
MRLYFHLLDHQDSLPDQEGVEVINVREAQAAVLEMLHVLRQEDESAAQDWSGWMLNVTPSRRRERRSMTKRSASSRTVARTFAPCARGTLAETRVASIRRACAMGTRGHRGDLCQSSIKFERYTSSHRRWTPACSSVLGQFPSDQLQ